MRWNLLDWLIYLLIFQAESTRYRNI
jgi:hypothetical protein